MPQPRKRLDHPGLSCLHPIWGSRLRIYLCQYGKVKSPLTSDEIYAPLLGLGLLQPKVAPLTAMLTLWRLHHHQQDWTHGAAYGIITGCLARLGVQAVIQETAVYITNPSDTRDPALYGRDPGFLESTGDPYFVMRLPGLHRLVDLFLPDLPEMRGSAAAPMPLQCAVQDGSLPEYMAVPRGDRLVVYIPGEEWGEEELIGLPGFREGLASRHCTDLLAELVDMLHWLPEALPLEHECWVVLAKVVRATERAQLAMIAPSQPVFISRAGRRFTMAELLDDV